VVTIVRFVAVLGVLIFAHELGHFVIAKWAGIRVEEFGFGYPPRLFTFMRRGGTEYTVNALPFGGFVRMLGEDDPSSPDSFASQSRKVRAAVLVAGPAMNVLLAVLVFAGAYTMLGEPVPEGFVTITAVEPGSPAAVAGIRPGDVIRSVPGERVYNNEQVLRITHEHLGEEIPVVVHRGLEDVELRLQPRKNPPPGQGPMGIRIEARVVRVDSIRYPPWKALGIGARRTAVIGTAMVVGLPELLRSLVQRSNAGNTEEVSKGVVGPIGIAQLTGEVADLGTVYLLEFIAFLSVNLAVINLLPLPALDGGRLMFVLIEGVRGGRRLDPRKEGYVHLVGMALLITLMLVITFFDLQRFFSGQSLLR